MKDLSLYRSSLLSTFEAFLLPDVRGRIPILCLVPDPTRHPESSLGFMMGTVMAARGGEGSGFFLTHEGRVEGKRFKEALEEAQSGEDPVLVATTAFALVQWLEYMNGGVELHLPTGSRVMETGGYKGRSTELPRDALYRALEGGMGVPADHTVGEYGMTELLSQFYEPVLPGSPGFPGSVELSERVYRGPPWVRTLVLDPLTLAPMPPGEVGVLAHLDLANVGSVASILTEDLGKQTQNGFQLVGRSPESEPRGCSLAMEDFLAARRRG